MALSELLSRKPLRKWLEEKLVNDVVAAGGDPKYVADAVKEVLSDRPILDWLMNGGWEQLVKLVLSILALLPKQ